MRTLSSDRALVDADDAALVPRLRRNDPAAAETAWQRFLPMVRATVRRLLGPSREEDDVIQEIFFRFFTAVGRLREPALVRGFLFGICVRVVRKEIRRRKLKSWLRLAADEETLDWPTMAGDHEAREAVGRFYRVLDALSGETRSLFVVRFIEGMELTEVARVHGISVSTAQRKLGRAVARVSALVRQDPALATYVSAQMFGGSR